MSAITLILNVQCIYMRYTFLISILGRVFYSNNIAAGYNNNNIVGRGGGLRCVVL